jgi:putative Holliday junction resolvase
VSNRFADLAVEDLARALPARAAVMGLDLGTRTIGVAISDLRRTIASPLDTIRRTKFTADAGALLGRAGEHHIAALIVGLPLNMDGSEGPRAQATRAFARNLSRLTDLPIAFWDERLSTAAVTRTLIAGDISRKRRSALVDKMAAAYILQGALDRMGGG